MKQCLRPKEPCPATPTSWDDCCRACQFHAWDPDAPRTGPAMHHHHFAELVRVPTHNATLNLQDGSHG